MPTRNIPVDTPMCQLKELKKYDNTNSNGKKRGNEKFRTREKGHHMNS